MSESKVYVGNLSFRATKEQIQDYFSQYGEIEDISIPTDRDTGRPRGFAFITFADEKSAQESLFANDKPFEGRNLKVNIARPRQ